MSDFVVICPNCDNEQDYAGDNECNECGVFIPNPSPDEGYCPIREDHTHCECWWDGDRKCCNCDHA